MKKWASSLIHFELILKVYYNFYNYLEKESQEMSRTATNNLLYVIVILATDSQTFAQHTLKRLLQIVKNSYEVRAIAAEFSRVCRIFVTLSCLFPNRFVSNFE